MRPRSVESINELKELGLTLQALDNALEQKQKLLNQEYLKKSEEITDLLEKNPHNILLNHRKKALNENYQQSINELTSERINIDKLLYEKIYTLIITQDNKTQYASFKNEFNHALTDLDYEISQKVTLVNEDIQSNVLEETRNIDTHIFTIVNKLAAKDIIVNIDQVMITLIMQLARFTDYDLEKANTLADEIVSHVTESHMANKKVSYEMLTKKIEKILDPTLERKFFVPLLHAIKKPCLEYIRHKELIYTELYNAKRLNFQKRLSEFNKKLIKQDQEKQYQARAHIKQNMLDHLLQSKNPKDFHLSIVKLGIEGLDAKRRSIEQKDEQYLTTFKQHQVDILQQLTSELNTILSKYSLENEIIYPAIKMLIPEVQQMYMQIAVAEYVPQSNENTSQHHASTTNALKSMDKQEHKTHPNQMMEKSLLRLNSYKEHMLKDNIRQFKLVLRFEKNIDILNQLKKEAESNPSLKSYLDIINHQLQHSHDYQRSFTNNIFTPPKISSFETTPIKPAIMSIK